MASRTPYAGTASDGDVYTAANHAKMPGGVFGYVFATANHTGITSGTNLNNLSVVVTPNSNRLIRISCFAHCGRTVNDGLSALSINKNTVNVQNILYTVKANNGYEPLSGVFLDVAPAASSTTYRLRLTQVSGTGSSFLQADSTAIAWIMVEDVGPTF
jgi:hypothetical protein